MLVTVSSDGPHGRHECGTVRFLPKLSPALAGLSLRRATQAGAISRVVASLGGLIARANKPTQKYPPAIPRPAASIAQVGGLGRNSVGCHFWSHAGQRLSASAFSTPELLLPARLSGVSIHRRLALGGLGGFGAGIRRGVRRRRVGCGRLDIDHATRPAEIVGASAPGVPRLVEGRPETPAAPARVVIPPRPPCKPRKCESS